MSSTDVEPAGGDRLVLAPDEPGPGHPRGARRGRHPRDSPAGTGTAASTTSSSGSSPRRSSRERVRRPRPVPAQAAVALPGARAARDDRERRALDELGSVGRDRPRGRAAAEVRRPARARRRAGRARRPRAGRGRGRSRVCATCRPTEIAAAGGRGARGPPVSAGRGAPGVAFLAALDPLAWDRDLLRSLYDFDYLWEVYVPAAKRRWGYYVLPIHLRRPARRPDRAAARSEGRTPSGSPGCGGRTASTRSRSPGSSRHSARPWTSIGRSAGCTGWRGRGRAAIREPREAGSGAPERPARGALAEVDDARHPGAAVALLVDSREPERRTRGRRPP